MDNNVLDLKRFKLILWDIDGTILNFFEAQKNALRFCFKTFNLGNISDAQILDYDEINHRCWTAIEAGTVSKKDALINRFKEFFSKYNIICDNVEGFNKLYQESLGDTVVFNPGVLDLITNLKKKGIKQYAVTNGTKIAQTKKLKNSGLDKILDRVFISEDVGYEKPDVRFFNKIMECAELDISNILIDDIIIIGDSLSSDMKFGNNAGIKTCLYNPKEKTFQGLRIDWCIENFVDSVFL